MSVAFRCDRCRGYFDPTFMILEDEVFAEISEIVYQNGFDFRRNSVSMREEKLHLCPSCVSEFLKFMRMVKKEGEQSDEVNHDSENNKKQYSFGNYTITCDGAGHCDDFNCILGDVCPGNDNARPNETPKWSSSSEEDSSGGSEV